MDEDAAIRAAIAISATETRPHTADFDNDDEDAPALVRRRNLLQAGTQLLPQPQQSAHGGPALDMFGSTPFGMPTPEPEPQPAQTDSQMDLHDFFGTSPAGEAAARDPSASADIFGMAPFNAAANPTANTAASGDLDAFGSVPFAGARRAEAPPAPATKDETSHDLLQGW